jgi:DNA topoisomerase-1
VLAAQALASLGPAADNREWKHHVAEAIGQVARRLGNTVTICRKCYVHPDVIATPMKKGLARALQRRSFNKGMNRLTAAESAVLRFLEGRNGSKRKRQGDPASDLLRNDRGRHTAVR